MRRVGLVAGLILIAACGSGSRGLLAFDGTDCDYTGGATFTESEPVIIEFENQSGGEAALLTFRIRAESSLVDLANAASTTSASALIGGGQMDVPSATRLNVASGETATSARHLDEGTYAVTCLVEADDRLFIGGSFVVSPESR